MAKAFSVVSWNVEHFGTTSTNGIQKKPVGPIIDYLASHNADVIAIYEVVGKTVFTELVTRMPGYQFHITEGPQTQEILVGVKKKFTSFFTQKTEFKSGAAALRPGALLTIVVDDIPYPLLFLHLKSMTDPKGFGLRDDMNSRSLKLRRSLDKAHVAQGLSGRSNFIFLGDLNTMGMDITYSNKDISAEEEIQRLRKRLSHKSIEMTLHDKSHPTTWWPGTVSSYAPSNLDHVVGADHLRFKEFNGSNVDVRGWVEKSTNAEKDQWVSEFSDHALLYFEVQKV